MDQISTPWVTVYLAQLLSRCVMTEESPKDKKAAGQDAPATNKIDFIQMKDSVCVGPFQAEILKGRVARVLTYDMHIMVAPIRHKEVVIGKAHPLPPGLQVLHAYTMLMAGSKQVLIVVQNMTDSAIFLKKGACVVHVVSAMLVPPAEEASEQAEGVQAPRERRSVQEWQEKLMDKLNLNGLSEWSPRNPDIAKELLLSIMTPLHLKLMNLGVPAPSNTKFALMMMNLSKNILGAYLHLY